MKIIGLRKVLISLIFGSIASIILLFIELKDIYKYINNVEFPFVSVYLLQAFLFSIGFLYVSLLFQVKRENLEDGNCLKTLEKLRLALQILFVLLTVSILYMPILSNFFYMFSILLLCIGAIMYYKTKSKLSVSIMVWGLVILFLTFLMIIFTYGIENCIIS